MYNNNNFQKTTGRSRDVPLVLHKISKIQQDTFVIELFNENTSQSQLHLNVS